MNILLMPNFHYAMHIEESILKFGSLYSTWMFPFECANRVLVNTNNNGHTLGELEVLEVHAVEETQTQQDRLKD
jgi:hypothetical protein